MFQYNRQKLRKPALLLQAGAHMGFKQFEKGKGQAIPLQAWTDPEGYRRLRLPVFKIIGT